MNQVGTRFKKNQKKRNAWVMDAHTVNIEIYVCLKEDCSNIRQIVWELLKIKKANLIKAIL